MYRTDRQSPAPAQNQLDYAFAWQGFHKSVTVRALNSIDKLGGRATTAAYSSKSQAKIDLWTLIVPAFSPGGGGPAHSYYSYNGLLEESLPLLLPC